jgi:predicted enzyme related to lactoylglutathione lyase
MPGLEIVLDCADTEASGKFWAAALGYQVLGAEAQYCLVAPPEGQPGTRLVLQQVAEPKTVKNRLHLDVIAPDIEAEAERLVALGATRGDDYAELGHRWIAMRDPEGNEFCVCEGNDLGEC